LLLSFDEWYILAIPFQFAPAMFQMPSVVENSIQVLRKDVTRVEHIVVLIAAVLLTGVIIYYKYFRNRWKADSTLA